MGGLLNKSFFFLLLLAFLLWNKTSSSLEEVFPFKPYQNFLQTYLQNHPNPWQVIWQIGAIGFPENSKFLAENRLKSLEKDRFNHLELAWWVLASWQIFLATEDMEFLKATANPANLLLEESDQKRSKKTKLLGNARSKKDYVELNMVVGQAWRVMGWIQAHLGDPNRALYCENRYHQIRLLLREELKNPSLPEDLKALAQIWYMTPRDESPKTKIANPFQQSVGSKEPKEIKEMVYIFRDVLGIQFWPYELAFVSQRPCEKEKNEIRIEDFSYRKAQLNVSLKGCGEESIVKLDGEKIYRIPGNIEGTHEVGIQLKS